MNITEIFTKILTAPKIGTATIAAMSVSGLFYLLSDKLGIVKDEALIVYTLFAFFGVLIFIIAMMIFFELRKQTIEAKLKEKEIEAKHQKPTEVRNIKQGEGSQYFEGNHGTININPKK